MTQGKRMNGSSEKKRSVTDTGVRGSMEVIRGLCINKTLITYVLQLTQWIGELCSQGSRYFTSIITDRWDDGVSRQHFWFICCRFLPYPSLVSWCASGWTWSFRQVGRWLHRDDPDPVSVSPEFHERRGTRISRRKVLCPSRCGIVHVWRDESDQTSVFRN